MKEFLKKLIATKEARCKEIKDLIQKSQSIDEIRSLGTEKETVETELAEARSQLASLEQTGFNPMQTLGTFTKSEARADEDPLSTMEYRKAFKDYVQRGIKNDILFTTRDASENVSTDLGILLPNTIVQEIIKDVEKVYGQLYSRVKKTNIKGGVQYPIGAFSANLVWSGTAGTDSEHGVSENQKAGSITGYVTFTYHIGEIRIAQSLLESVVSVDVFEREIVNALVEAYVKAMDVAIMNGTGSGQPEGILTEAAKASNGRITAARVISVSPDEMADWTTFKKKLYAKIPLAMRALKPEFVLNAGTFESNLECLKDANGQPVAREITNPVNGALTAKFDGREVVFVEADIFKAFDDASTNDYFGMYWVPEKAYAINSNLQFGYKKYFDEATNQWITKALVIVDGKILDPKYIYLLKKAANA